MRLPPLEQALVVAAALGVGYAMSTARVSGAGPSDLLVSQHFRSIDDYMERLAFWKQRLDVNGDDRFDDSDIYDFIGRKGAAPGDDRFHFGFDFDGNDQVDNADINVLFDVARRFRDGYVIDPASDVPTLSVIAAYYPWYTSVAVWNKAASVPVRGRYQSLDPVVYLRQRLEAHVAGIDIFAVSTSPSSDEVRRFHDMQAELERTEDPALTRFVWLYEILARLPFVVGDFGREIVNFDDPTTRQDFILHMVELASYFHDNYLTIDGTYYPIWIWKTDTIRGDFVHAVSDARDAVRSQFGKELVIIGSELAQFPVEEPALAKMQDRLDAEELAKRFPAFFAMTHYGIYSPLLTDRYRGELSIEHTDVTIQNLLAWIRILRSQGTNNIYGRRMEYWPPLQFGFDDRNVPGRHNPVMSASQEQLEYYVQQLHSTVVVPNRDIIRFLNHTSYNEHLEGHGMEPTTGYNSGRQWLRINSVYLGPSKTYRRLIVDDPEFVDEFAAIFAAQASDDPSFTQPLNDHRAEPPVEVGSCVGGRWSRLSSDPRRRTGRSPIPAPPDRRCGAGPRQ